MKRIAISLWHQFLQQRNINVSLGLASYRSHLGHKTFMGWKEGTKKLVQLRFEEREENEEKLHARKCRVVAVLDHLSQDCEKILPPFNPRIVSCVVPEDLEGYGTEKNTISSCDKLKLNNVEPLDQYDINHTNGTTRLKSGCGKTSIGQSGNNDQVSNRRLLRVRSKVDITRRRKMIMDKHLSAKKKGDMKNIDSSCHQDDNERLVYLRKKRQDRDLARWKKAKTEEANKAIKLANLHYVLTLLKRCLIHYWKGYIQVMRLRECKVFIYIARRYCDICCPHFSNLTILYCYIY